MRDSLSPYLSQLRKLPLLSAEEEHQLGMRAHEGDLAAKMHLVQHNLRLVVRMAKSFQHRGVALEDLIEEGNLGLIHAVEKFDPNRGCRLSTYAGWWVRESMEKLIFDQSHLIRLPTHLLKSTYREQLHAKTCFLEDLDPNTALDAQAPDVSDLVGQQELKSLIQTFLKDLRSHEKEVLVRRFGLDGFEPHTLHATSQSLGLSKERVRQIQLSALKRLRCVLTGMGIYDGSFEVH